MDTPILTVEEAVAFLKVESVDWLQKSTCPRLRIGGKVRYDRDEILAWARSHSTVRKAA